MRSWLRKMCVSQAAQVAVTDLTGVTPATLLPSTPMPAIPTPAVVPSVFESLEGRCLLSASYDVTNAYTGSITVKAGKVKVKEAINITLVAQTESGYVSGQISSGRGGKVDVRGVVQGTQLKLVGATSGRLLIAKIGKKGLSFSGTLVNGIDDSVGKFKVKRASDAPESLPAAGRAEGAVSPTTSAPRKAAARALAAEDGGPLDPSIDPTSGLPIDPVTGTPVNPGTLPPDPTNPDGGTAPELPTDFPTDGAAPVPVSPPPVVAPPVVAPPLAPPITAAAPGDLIGNNFSILGEYTGTFNPDGTGTIEDIATGATTGPARGGTTPGIDPRVATFDTDTQDDTGLVSGTLTIANFGTFTYTGFVNGSSIELVLTGTAAAGSGSGLVTLTLNAAGDAFVGDVFAAEANGFRANGPVTAIFTGPGTGGPGPGPGPGGPGQGGGLLPDGEELYHVDRATNTGVTTVGNFDPNNASLGTDFAVGLVPLVINSLGAFDSGADGLVGPISVAIYNTASPGTPIVVAEVTTANSELVPNSSFRYLTSFTPVTLTGGIYRLVAFGFDNQDLAGDVGGDSYAGPAPAANTGSTGREVVYPASNSLDSNNYTSQPGGGGTGGGGTLTFPTQPADLPINRYLAGSALFEEGVIVDPGDPGPVTPPPPPPPVLTKPAGSAFPGGVLNGTSGPEVFGSQSGNIIPG